MAYSEMIDSEIIKLQNPSNISFKTIWTSILALILSANAYAFNLVGTYQLISVKSQNKAGQWESDCHSPSGLLTYTAKKGWMLSDRATGKTLLDL